MPERDRIMSPKLSPLTNRMVPADILLMLWPKKPDGSPGISRRWLIESFLREKRQKLGKWVFWYEADLREAGISLPDVLPYPSDAPREPSRDGAAPSSGRLTLDQKPGPIAYPRDCIITLRQLASALQVEERTAQSMDLPYFYAGKRQRFIWSQVLDTLAERARNL